MLSLKDTLRKVIVTATLAAVTTHFFTGCSNDPVTSSDLYAPSQVYDIEEGTPSLTDEMTPGINETDTDSFSIKYKYWYDNPEVKEVQEQSLAEANQNPGSLTNKNFLNLDSLPIYTDSEGNEYIISGRTKVYLKDGKIAPKDLFNYLRVETSGERIYVGLVDSTYQTVSEFASKVAALNQKQPETYDERIGSGDGGSLSSDKVYEVYLNNTDTFSTFSSSEKCLDISSLLEAYNLGSTKITDKTTVELILYTAAGDVSVSFKVKDDKCEISYSTDVKDQSIDANDLIITDTRIFLSLAVIEDYLGYDVEYYDDFINIVTDNKDIVKQENVVTEDVLASVDNTLNNNDTTKPATDPDNVKEQEDLEEQLKKDQEEAEQNPYADLAGKDGELTDEDYFDMGITPPGQEESDTPTTNSEGKTAAQVREEIEDKINEDIKNGNYGFDDKNLEAALNNKELAEKFGWSQEDIDAAKSQLN